MKTIKPSAIGALICALAVAAICSRTLAEEPALRCGSAKTEAEFVAWAAAIRDKEHAVGVIVSSLTTSPMADVDVVRRVRLATGLRYLEQIGADPENADRLLARYYEQMPEDQHTARAFVAWVRLSRRGDLRLLDDYLLDLPHVTSYFVSNTIRHQLHLYLPDEVGIARLHNEGGLEVKIRAGFQIMKFDKSKRIWLPPD